jgi:hypothetical protein
MEHLQILAGSIAGLIFTGASLNMVIRAWRTKDLHPYSLGQMVLNNVGNLFHWLYVVSPPPGPVWFSHAFFTLASLLMLIWYFAYRPSSTTATTSTPVSVSSQQSIQHG